VSELNKDANLCLSCKKFNERITKEREVGHGPRGCDQILSKYPSPPAVQQRIHRIQLDREGKCGREALAVFE
jgi:hypothetical protein